MKQPLEDFAIKEAKVFLKTVSEGLKSLAKGVETLAKQVGTLAEAQTEKKAPKTAPKKPVKAEAARQTAKPRRKQKGKSEPASETVFKLIGRSRTGITTAALVKKTGFNAKKIHNIIYRLKHQGRIKTIRKGVYVKA